MSRDARKDSLRLLPWTLHVSTSRWQPPLALALAEADGLQRAWAQGWRLRQASPRWDIIWQPRRHDLARTRFLLLPAAGFGYAEADLCALSRDRLVRQGLKSGPAKNRLSWSPARAWLSGIARQWRGAVGRPSRFHEGDDD